MKKIPSKGVTEMWRPKKIGLVVAERRCEFRDPNNRVRKLKIVFGRPVRQRNPSAKDPWWCPVEIIGRGFARFETIAAHDSLQALALGLGCIERWLVHQAKICGGEILVHGIYDSPILCHSSLSYVGTPSKRKRKPAGD